MTQLTYLLYLLHLLYLFTRYLLPTAHKATNRAARLQSSGATKQCRLCTRPFQACSHTVTWLSPLPGVARADIASGLGAMHATASRSPWPYLLWRHTYYSAILTMSPYLLWRRTYYGAVLTMAPYLLWRRTYYGAVLTRRGATLASVAARPADRCPACRAATAATPVRKGCTLRNDWWPQANTYYLLLPRTRTSSNY